MSISVFPPTTASGSITSLFSNVVKFDTSDVWSHPNGYSVARPVIVVVVAGGGGGGSGGRRIGTTISDAGVSVWAGGGGGGGSGGSAAYSFLNSSQLTITIGAGGAKGASTVSASNLGSTNGNNGSNGGTSSVVQNSVTLVSCGGGGGGKAGQALSASNSGTINITDFQVGGAAGTNGGLAGGNAANTNSTQDTAIDTPAGNGDAVTGSFKIAVPNINSSFPIPYLTDNDQPKPMPGAGGGSTWKTYVLNNAGTVYGSPNATAQTPAYVDWFFLSPGGDGGNFTRASNVTSGNPGSNATGIGCGGGGGGGFWYSAQNVSANSISSAAGGDGEDGAVWIFY